MCQICDADPPLYRENAQNRLIETVQVGQDGISHFVSKIGANDRFGLKLPKNALRHVGNL
jgi:hypothetical protein